MTRRLPDEALGRLRRAGATSCWDGDGPMPADELARQLRDATGLVCMLTDRVDGPLVARAPALRVVSQVAVGVDNIDLAACTQAGIPVGHTPGVLTETTADSAFALLAAAARRVVEGVDHVRAGRWGPWQPDLLLGRDLHGTTLAILGLGRIGTAVARRAAGFDMSVLYSGPRRKPEAEAATGARYVGFDELLERADHLVLCAPLTPATYHVIDERALARMRPHATLVNVARGGLVDSHALAEALRDGTIAAAALDVTEPEPLPADHELLGLASCIVTPHLASASVSTRARMAAVAVDNLLAGLAGEPLPHCANPEVYAGRRRSAPSPARSPAPDAPARRAAREARATPRGGEGSERSPGVE
ncbi:MAG TPA: D-glycerate dehydrogenase [Acidimicrobiales bacterium]|nr:D-glycerate dehydrogenase [Acidimicrobiales bacterium]